MNEIRLWRMPEASQRRSATASLEIVRNTETEELLEQAMVENPAILEQGLTLVARQLPTANGPLDLLGIDQDGRLVIFELKRGTLTREAVTQIIDYASDLDLMDLPELLDHVANRSGKAGITNIDDAEDWLEQRGSFDAEALAMTPRLVLVGLGIDPRARRMVNYLAAAGLEIDLLNFTAFELDGELLLARQVEVDAEQVRTANRAGDWTPEAMAKAAHAKAKDFGVADLFCAVKSAVGEALGTDGHPKKSGVTYYLPAVFDDPPSLAPRAYASITMRKELDDSLGLSLTIRALDAAGEDVQALLSKYDAKQSKHFRMGFIQWIIAINRENWEGIRTDLSPVLSIIAKAVEAGVQAFEA